jgi:putative transcriptional regulator
MSEENIIRVNVYRDGRVMQQLDDGSERELRESEADWRRFDRLTDEDAEYNALMDPDEEPFLTDEDREKIKTLVDPKVIRKRLKLTQVEFAERFAIPLGTLRDWERRARFPDSAARAYLRVISEDPELVCKALKRSYDRMPALTT